MLIPKRGNTWKGLSEAPEEGDGHDDDLRDDAPGGLGAGIKTNIVDPFLEPVIWSGEEKISMKNGLRGFQPVGELGGEHGHV